MTIVFDQSSALASSDDGNADSGVNFRITIATSLLSAASGNQGQVKVLFGTGCPTETPAIDSMWIGQTGATDPNFTGNQVQVKFGGVGTINGSAAGVVTSDTFTLGENWDNTKKYTVAFHVNDNPGTTSVSQATVTGVTGWNSTTGAADNSSATTPTGLSSTASFLNFVEQIIISSGDTLQSQIVM